MALSDSAVSELLDAFRAGDGVDLVRESVRLVLQELIEVEAAQVIGAGRYERTPDRVTERNGSRPRELMTKAGTVELAIPRRRGGGRNTFVEGGGWTHPAIIRVDWVRRAPTSRPAAPCGVCSEFDWHKVAELPEFVRRTRIAKQHLIHVGCIQVAGTIPVDHVGDTSDELGQLDPVVGRDILASRPPI